MATRSRKDEKSYAAHRKNVHAKVGCIFCDYEESGQSYKDQTKSFVIINNIYPYSHWDGQGVLDHLLVVPKKHTDTLSDLDSNEAIEYVNLIASYESKGYSVYSRAPASNRKTVIHQHTHLIKLDNQTKKVVFYLKKPYIRFVK